MTIDEMSQKYEKLNAKRKKLIEQKMTIDAEVRSKKKKLKELVDECKSRGYNPDDLENELSKLKLKLEKELEDLEKNLTEAEEKIKPMMERIRQ